MSGVSRARLERSVDICEAIRVAIYKAVDGQVVFVGKRANEPPGGARRRAAHFDDDAISGLPESMIVDSNLLRGVFERVVGICLDVGLIKGEGFAVDASVIEADASRISMRLMKQRSRTKAARPLK